MTFSPLDLLFLLVGGPLFLIQFIRLAHAVRGGAYDLVDGVLLVGSSFLILYALGIISCS